MNPASTGDSAVLLDNDEPQDQEQETVEGWDVFRDPPKEDDDGSAAAQERFQLPLRLMKGAVVVAVFAVVLASGVTARGSALFMANQLAHNITLPYCNRDLAREKYLMAVVPEVERVAWIWAVIFAYWIPEFMALVLALRMACFKSLPRPPPLYALAVFLTQSAQVVGTALLFFCVLPNLDSVKGLMLVNCLSIVPAVLTLFALGDDSVEGKKKRNPLIRTIKLSLDLVAVGLQATGLILWPLTQGGAELWLTPLAIALISLGHWENFLRPGSRVFAMLGKQRSDLDSKYVIYLGVSLWKMLLFMLSVMAILYVREDKVNFMFDQFVAAFTAHTIPIQEIRPVLGGTSLPNRSELIPSGQGTTVFANESAPLNLLLIHVLSAYCCYIFAKFACKIVVQKAGFALPLNLVIPVSLSIIVALCGLRTDDPCAFHYSIPSYLWFRSPDLYSLSEFLAQSYGWAWLLWLVSQVWVCLHLWSPRCERLATTDILFMQPMYEGLLVEHSLILNRRKYDDEKEISVKKKDGDDSNRSSDASVDTEAKLLESEKMVEGEEDGDNIVQIYACATMWHETKEEMIGFLKSIFRLDADQCARRIARGCQPLQTDGGLDTHHLETDYYDLEVHIFFDDAFAYRRTKEGGIERQVNQYVRYLVEAMDKAAMEVHEVEIHVEDPVKYPTPYGGRLEWTLPGGNKLVTHLKDKNKIRHKKRWSQCMYMYYLLGHRLVDKCGKSTNEVEALDTEIEKMEYMDKLREANNKKGNNTFLLALDGDIDFQPYAVLRLLDLMRRDRKKVLGAACGRIHPVGSGPMVWYQMFEYAIGHWLQKATEHTIGCVLCSPGCFSLFRGFALMDENVMKKYTTKSEEAMHYVQFDQGEDRWLCTLLLQRGYRVEYSAASDAFTHCPEGFNEFYNQRRRWIPSTMANIMDLLVDYKRTIGVNDNISLLYIAYQILLMGGTILGPGTIFLMLVGAFVAAFQIDNWTSFYINLIPILVFMFVCLACNSDIQLFVAGVISAIYGLIMMAVLVGIMLQIQNDGVFAPSSIFFFLVAGEMIIAALLHPQELSCLPAGVVYYVTVPSMYLLLIIYSVFNMNNVSWGTREVETDEPTVQTAEQKLAAEEAAKAKKEKTLFEFLQGGKGKHEKEGSSEFSLAGQFSVMCCNNKKDKEQEQQLQVIQDKLEVITKKLEKEQEEENGSLASDDTDKTLPADEAKPVVHIEPRDDMLNPYWIEDDSLGEGPTKDLASSENEFWEKLMKKYLYPLDENTKYLEEKTKQLKDLRDKVVFAFFMLNALFVLVVFLLTLKKDFIHINWPFDVKVNVTYSYASGEVQLSKKYLQLEPIGLVFVFFFGIILVIQFTAMLFHRTGTFSQILATTEVKRAPVPNHEGSVTWESTKSIKDPVERARLLQRLKKVEEDICEDDQSKISTAAGRKKSDMVGRRKTQQVLSGITRTKQITSLEAAFQKRFDKRTISIDAPSGREPNQPYLRRNTVHQPNHRNR